MRFSLAVAAVAAPVLSVVAQQNFLVTVGANALLAFNPPNITANNGDTVTFQFQSKNHSVTQSTFLNPCSIQTAPQGIDSGFQFVSPNATELPEWSFTVTNSSAPLWFFCAQTNPANHCHAGMVFAVNANPASAKSFDVYQANAKALANAAAPAGSAVASGAAAATSAIGSAIGGVVGDLTSVAGDATSLAGAAATGAASVAAGALTGAAGALTGAAGALTGAATSAPSASATGNSTAPGNGSGRVTASAVSMLAAVGLAAGLLL